MVQEDLNNRTIALSFKASRFSQDVLKKAVAAYLDYHKSHKTIHHGKTSVKKLMAQDQGAATIPVAARNFRDFERAARKYNVDFAVMREKGGGKEARASPKQYTVFFKAKDTDAINRAFKEFVERNEKRKERPSVREKLRAFSERAKKAREQKVKVKKKERAI